MHRRAHQEQDRFQTECQEDTMKGFPRQHRQGQVEELNISRRSCTLLGQLPELLKETTWMILRPESVQWNQVLCRNHLQVELVLLVLGRELQNHYPIFRSMCLPPQES